MSPVDFIRGMDRAGRGSTPTRTTRTPCTRGDTPFVGGCTCKTITMAISSGCCPARRRRLPAGARLADRVRRTRRTRPTTSASVGGEQARYIGESARRVYAAPKVDMLIHYLYRDEPDLARWQSGLETIDAAEARARGDDAPARAGVAAREPDDRVGPGRPGRRTPAATRSRAVGRAGSRSAERTPPRPRLPAPDVAAPKGAELRIWYPARRLASPTLSSAS